MKKLLLCALLLAASTMLASAADYQLTATDTVIRTRDGAHIPGDPGNWDRKTYNAWLAAGNVPDPYVPPSPPVPQSITAMQAKVALSRAGRLAAVQTWVNTQDTETQLIWNSASSFNRGSALINSAATALGMTPAEVDQLFVAAAAINP